MKAVPSLFLIEILFCHSLNFINFVHIGEPGKCKKLFTDANSCKQVGSEKFILIIVSPLKQTKFWLLTFICFYEAEKIAQSKKNKERLQSCEHRPHHIPVVEKKNSEEMEVWQLDFIKTEFKKASVILRRVNF